MPTHFIHDSLSPNSCTLVCEDEVGRFYERDFFAPLEGGCVMEDLYSPRQICKGLARRGPVLHWYPSSGPLANLIMREAARIPAPRH